MKLGEVFKPQVTGFVKAGMYVQHPHSKDIYLLTMHASEKMSAVRIDGFGTYGRDILVSSTDHLSESELGQLLGPFWREYTVVNPLNKSDVKNVGSTLKEFFNHSTSARKIGLGTYVRDPSYYGHTYILGSAGFKDGNYTIVAVSLDNGFRHGGPYTAIDTGNLTESEIAAICGGNWREWELLTRDQALAA